MSTALAAQAVALVLAVGAGSWAIMGRDIREPRQELAAALAGCRFTAGRLVGFEHAGSAAGSTPCRSNRRLAQVSRTIQQDDGPAPSALADRALLHLANGEPHEAIELLTKALERDAENASRWNDLAAAYLEAAVRDEPWHLVLAVRSARRALELDPSLMEARFNLALALDRLYPSDPAAEAWEAYLELDGRSGWASEARERLAFLRSPADAEPWAEAVARLSAAAGRGDRAAVVEIVARFPQQARLRAEEELLPRWGLLVEAGREAEAAVVLAEARAIGSALAGLGGERMVADSVAVIDGAARADRAALARGHRAFGEGRGAYATDYGRAAGLFSASRAALSSAPSPFAGWAVYHLARCAYQRGDHREVFSLLGPLAEGADADRHPSLRGKSFWLMGLTRVKEGRIDAALPFYLDALDAFERARETEQALGVRNLIAEGFRHLGDRRSAWAHLVPVLHGLPGVADQALAQGMLQEAAEASLALGEPEVALLFQDERVRRLGPAPDAMLLALALYKRSVVRELAGDRDGAATDLDRVVRAVEAVGDPLRHEQTLAYLLDAQGRLARWASPREAVESFGRSIAAWGSLGNHRVVPGLLLRRGRAFFDLGLEDRAERDLLDAVTEIERQAAEGLDETLVPTFRQQQREALEALVDLAARRGEPARALALAEHRRAGRAALADGSEPEARRALAEALSGVAPDTAVVAYLALEDRLLAWVSRAGRLRLVEQRIARQDLERLILRLGQEILASSPETRTQRASHELFRRLIAPVAEELRVAETLVVVPDAVLQPVPFGALVDPSTDRFLVESHEVAKAPSLDLLARPGRAAGAGEPSVLVAGDPAFDRGTFRWLSRLPAAAREARDVESAFARAVALVADDATKDEFVARAPEFDILHFAGHTILNEKRPEASGLLFAPGAHSDSPVLTAEEIERLPLDRTRLVVLSACGTADGALAAGEGAMSLARAFLVAGAPAVVASRWQVGDEPTTDLVARFYRELRGGRSPLAALREAQLEMIRAGRPADDWAAFELIGTQP